MEGAWCTKAELSERADSETPGRLLQAEYVLRRAGAFHVVGDVHIAQAIDLNVNARVKPPASSLMTPRELIFKIVPSVGNEQSALWIPGHPGAYELRSDVGEGRELSVWRDPANVEVVASNIEEPIVADQDAPGPLRLVEARDQVGRANYHWQNEQKPNWGQDKQETAGEFPSPRY